MSTLRSYGAWTQSRISIYKHCAPTELGISKLALGNLPSLAWNICATAHGTIREMVALFGSDHEIKA
jgi:hypothetical protein